MGKWNPQTGQGKREEGHPQRRWAPGLARGGGDLRSSRRRTRGLQAPPARPPRSLFRVTLRRPLMRAPCASETLVARAGFKAAQGATERLRGACTFPGRTER